MKTAALNELEQSLRDQLRLSESAMQDLMMDLHAVDDELVVLKEKQDRYDKIENICASLEELEDDDVAHLFWGDDNDEEAKARLSHARWQIGQYHEEIVEVETRREKIQEEIKQQDKQLDYLHYDLQDIIEREEAANDEWVLERDEAASAAHIQIMPWSRGAEEDRRFKISLGGSIAAALAFILLIGMIVIPLEIAEEEAELPDRMARLVEQRKLPPPPPPAPEPEAVEEEVAEPEPEPELVEEIPDEPVPASNEVPQVAQDEPVVDKVQTAGILAFREKFASRSQLQQNAQLGSDARLNNAGTEAGLPERKMVTSTAPGSSGGINLAEISRDYGGGGGQIDGVAVSRVASSIGSGDAMGTDRPLAAGAVAGRTDEEIQIVFDRYKAALYRLYNRELRRDPTLRGQLVLRLTIEPDGSVSFCELQSSSMDAPALADQVVNRVKTFDFGAKEDIV
ncbi:MAG: AgmX/PglI C-terminal domain-containing protein, partial [Woeseiaceae bacterium]